MYKLSVFACETSYRISGFFSKSGRFSMQILGRDLPQMPSDSGGIGRGVDSRHHRSAAGLPPGWLCQRLRPCATLRQQPVAAATRFLKNCFPPEPYTSIFTRHLFTRCEIPQALGISCRRVPWNEFPKLPDPKSAGVGSWWPGVSSSTAPGTAVRLERAGKEAYQVVLDEHEEAVAELPQG